MRLSRVVSIVGSVVVLAAASAMFAVEVFAHDKHEDRHERYREAREYPHIHGDWRKPYIPPRTHDSERTRDDSYLESDDRRSRSDYDYLSDDESEE